MFHNNAIGVDASHRGAFVFFPAMVLKSSASASDADTATKIASVVFQYFTPCIMPLLLFTPQRQKDNAPRASMEAADVLIRPAALRRVLRCLGDVIRGNQ